MAERSTGEAGNQSGGPSDGSADFDHESVDRRSFLAAASSVAMVAGLAAGYGTFGVLAGRYLFPTGRGTAWMFVTDLASFPAGESVSFESPSGIKAVITRRSRVDGEVGEEDFLALSSVCPHLGCRVHWEQVDNRFFCPCHNGEFDPDGVATGGPPKAAGQRLPRYPLMIQNGMLLIEMPLNIVGGGASSSQHTDHRASGPTMVCRSCFLRQEARG